MEERKMYDEENDACAAFLVGIIGGLAIAFLVSFLVYMVSTCPIHQTMKEITCFDGEGKVAWSMTVANSDWYNHGDHIVIENGDETRTCATSWSWKNVEEHSKCGCYDDHDSYCSCRGG
jgi:hypothetical protein